MTTPVVDIGEFRSKRIFEETFHGLIDLGICLGYIPEYFGGRIAVEETDFGYKGEFRFKYVVQGRVEEGQVEFSRVHRIPLPELGIR